MKDNIDRANDNDNSNNESNNFYDRWKGIVQNQFTLDNDTDTASAVSDIQTQKNLDTQTFESCPEDHQQRENLHNGNELGIGYNYDNLLKIANYKVRSKVKFPDNKFTQKQVDKCEENRYKINAVYQEHSIWLKNLKNQVMLYYYFEYLEFLAKHTVIQ